ncbi:SMC5-SMC6 complex localization factor protein 2-like [Patiria miniata]|uniref:Coiled-coil SMC6 And NSE5 INteracting (CANIN) domain-containing protein n=1 Tax=Patiria miniata TaxID=46514 RepID=A0A914AME6_PATMI|nr:SMC5-SMC6 complex localization factor protein 2-like [Patiria miniata]
MAEDDEREEEDRDFKPNQGQGREFGGESTALESRNLENVPLLPEHEKTLQQYALQNESIATLHPGEDIFCNADIGKLFTFPVGLSLFEANAMEKLVMTSSPDELKELLMSRLILDMYTGKKCPDPVMLWLLQLLSICDSELVAGMIFDTMWSLMNSCQHLLHNAKPWCPILQDIAAIFVNYGARLDSMLPPSLFQSNFIFEDISARYGQDKKKSEIPGCETKPNCLPGYNLQQVIKIITQCLLTHERNPSLHEDDLISLAYMVCKISLDKQLVRSVCIAVYILHLLSD